MLVYKVVVGGAAGSGVRLTFKGKLSRGRRCLSLADQRCLFEGDEDGSHPGNVLRLFAGFGVEVAQAGHPLPLRAGAAVVRLGQERLLRCPAGTDGRQ